MLKVTRFQILILIIIYIILQMYFQLTSFSSLLNLIMIGIYFYYVIDIVIKLNNLRSFLNYKDKTLFKLSIITIFVNYFYNLYLFIILFNKDEFEKLRYFENNYLDQILNISITLTFVALMPYLLVKLIISFEQNKQVKVSNYIKEFFISIFPPTFIIFMVPRINQIYENFIAEIDEVEVD